MATRTNTTVYQTKIVTLEQNYNRLLVEKKKLEEDIETRVKQAVWEKQEYCYKLEKEIRQLKSEIEYYTTNTENKDSMVSDLRLKITSNQRELDNLKKQLSIAEDAYEKAELRLKEVLKHEYQPVSTYVVRTVRAESGASDSGSTTQVTTVTKTGTNVATDEQAYASGISATSTPKVLSPETKKVEVNAVEKEEISNSSTRVRTSSASRPTSTYNFNVGRSTASYSSRTYSSSASAYSRPTASAYSRYTRKYNS